jgi:CHAD domain-containing protein
MKDFSESVIEVIQQQIDRAIYQAVDPVFVPDELVYELRKSSKRIKALFQLLQPLVEKKHYYQIEETISKTGRILSDQRDSSVNLVTFQKLFVNQVNMTTRDAYDKALQLFMTYSATAYNNKLNEFDNRIFLYLTLLNNVRKELTHCQIEPADTSFFLNRLEKSFNTAFTFLRHTEYLPETEIIHSWRKSLKKLLLQLKFLPIAQKSISHDFLNSLDKLTEILGREHDLAVLGKKISQIDSINSGDKLRMLKAVQTERRSLLLEVLCFAKQNFSSAGLILKQETAQSLV